MAVVHIVLSVDLIHEVYDRLSLAERHAKCFTGAQIVSIEVKSVLPKEIQEDLAVENEYDENEDTPIVEMADIDNAKDP